MFPDIAKILGIYMKSEGEYFEGDHIHKRLVMKYRCFIYMDTQEEWLL